MTKTSNRLGYWAKVLAVYGLVLGGVLGFSLIRARLSAAKQAELAEAPVFSNEPFFSLTTNRTFAPTEGARLSASYRSIDHLDFRVYQVKDPLKFFKQLEDPHKMGEDEKQQLSSSYRSRLRLLERAHSIKSTIFSAIKEYVRRQLQRDHREKFNQKFRNPGGPSRTPLNIADYARVPLLNSNQLVSAWRERLPVGSEDYDQQVINLGKRTPGVYLVEAVNEGLRAYSIVVVTELTMVQKSTRDGQVLVYVVDRKSGAPHANVSIEIAHGKEKLTTGTTDKSGIFKTELKKPAEDDSETPPEDVDPEAKEPHSSYLIFAHERDNFVISDLDSFYFAGEGDEGDGSYDPSVTSYIYTDRPIYRPAQKVYYRGIIRRWGRNGYELIDSKTVSVTIEDPNSGKIRSVSCHFLRGTSAAKDVAEDAPLGSYRLVATAEIQKSVRTSKFRNTRNPSSR